MRWNLLQDCHHFAIIDAIREIVQEYNKGLLMPADQTANCHYVQGEDRQREAGLYSLQCYHAEAMQPDAMLDICSSKYIRLLHLPSTIKKA